MTSLRRSARIRWAAPVLVAAVIGIVAVVPTLSAGATTPSLPKVTPQQLLVMVQQTKVQSLSGTIQVTANLGLPNLGALAGAAGRDSAFNPTDLLSGTHSADIWIDGPDKQKIRMTSSLAETDVIHNGQNVWTWHSTGTTADHTTVSPHAAGAAKPTGAPKPEAKPEAKPDANPGTPETPEAAANAILSQITPSTTVAVSKPLMVAGQKAYELTLTPNDPNSTVARVAIAVDSLKSVPLRVSVYAKDQSKVAFQVGFTKINYGTPAKSTFDFTPPKGATVTTNGAGAPTKPSRHLKRAAAERAQPATSATPSTGATKTQTVGADWSQVVIFSNSGGLPPQADEVLGSIKPTAGAFGTGKVVHTALLNFLVLNDGRIAAGAVTAQRLEAAVATGH